MFYKKLSGFVCSCFFPKVYQKNAQTKNGKVLKFRMPFKNPKNEAPDLLSVLFLLLSFYFLKKILITKNHCYQIHYFSQNLFVKFLWKTSEQQPLKFLTSTLSVSFLSQKSLNCCPILFYFYFLFFDLI